MYETPVAWIMASNSSSNIGTRTIKKLHEALVSGKTGGRVLGQKMDVITQPESLTDGGLVDVCKLCNDMYVSSAEVECDVFTDLDKEVIVKDGTRTDLRSFLLDMKVSDTDSQQLVMHADTKKDHNDIKHRSDDGIILTCDSSMTQLLINRVAEIDSYMKASLTDESYSYLFDLEDKGKGNYLKSFQPAPKNQQKRKTQYSSTNQHLKSFACQSKATSIITTEEANKRSRISSPTITYAECCQLGTRKI